MPEESPVNLEYANDIVLFDENTEKMKSFLIIVGNNASIVRMRFAPTK